MHLKLHICTGLLYHSEGTWSRSILLLCSHRGMCSNTTGAFNMLWKWDISITIIWLRSRRLQMFSKNSSLKEVQINCIRMEIVFCVPQQVLLERTNFHLGPNSFENVILCSLQYILTNTMNPFVHTIWSVCQLYCTMSCVVLGMSKIVLSRLLACKTTNISLILGCCSQQSKWWCNCSYL